MCAAFFAYCFRDPSFALAMPPSLAWTEISRLRNGLARVYVHFAVGSIIIVRQPSHETVVRGNPYFHQPFLLHLNLRTCAFHVSISTIHRGNESRLPCKPRIRVEPFRGLGGELEARRHGGAGHPGRPSMQRYIHGIGVLARP